MQVRDDLLRGCLALLKTRHFFVFSVCAMLISSRWGPTTPTLPRIWRMRVLRMSVPPCRSQMSEIFFMLVIPAAVPPPRARRPCALDRHAGVVCALRHVCAMRKRGRILPISAFCCTASATISSLLSALSILTVAGEKVKGQAQSMIVMFTYGIGMLLGSQISGAFYNRLWPGRPFLQAWVTFCGSRRWLPRRFAADFPSHV